MNQELTIKYKNTLQNLIILLIGIILLLIGLVAYIWTQEFSYFYLIALANILVVFVLIKSQVKKHYVVYDAVFVKYKLENEKVVKRLKVSEIKGVELKEQKLLVHLAQEREAEIELAHYSKKSITEFKELLEKMAKMNG
jgi:multisubunit Na+/H+ antiporter MnhG subunit